MLYKQGFYTFIANNNCLHGKYNDIWFRNITKKNFLLEFYFGTIFFQRNVKFTFAKKSSNKVRTWCMYSQSINSDFLNICRRWFFDSQWWWWQCSSRLIDQSQQGWSECCCKRIIPKRPCYRNYRYFSEWKIMSKLELSLYHIYWIWFLVTSSTSIVRPRIFYFFWHFTPPTISGRLK